jgi:pimeloyl-ACP methyl ester carboxylesterase
MTAVRSIPCITRFSLGDRFSLVADVAGPPSGPPVILLHGGAQSRRAWAAGLTRLVDAGFRIVSLDMRGHGDSDWAPDGRYDVAAFGDDLKSVVAQIAAETGRRVALIGASRGGQSALLAAADRPDLVAAVVLVDVTPRTDDSGVRVIRAFLQRSAEGFESVEQAGRALAQFMNRPPRSDVSGLARAMRRDAAGRWFWQWDPRMADSRFVKPPDEEEVVEAAAVRTRCPILLIRAGNSELVRDTHVVAFRAVAPQVEVVEIPGIGHMMTGDSNEAFIPPMVAFLDRTMSETTVERRPLGS